MRAERQWQKFGEEERHFEYLHARGLTSVEIADRLIHTMLEVLREGIKNQHPNATEAELRMLLKSQLRECEELRALRRRKNRG